MSQRRLQPQAQFDRTRSIAGDGAKGIVEGVECLDGLDHDVVVSYAERSAVIFTFIPSVLETAKDSDQTAKYTDRGPDVVDGVGQGLGGDLGEDAETEPRILIEASILALQPRLPEKREFPSRNRSARLGASNEREWTIRTHEGARSCQDPRPLGRLEVLRESNLSRTCLDRALGAQSPFGSSENTRSRRRMSSSRR